MLRGEAPSPSLATRRLGGLRITARTLRSKDCGFAAQKFYSVPSVPSVVDLLSSGAGLRSCDRFVGGEGREVDQVRDRGAHLDDLRGLG
jgi:hypothetical protein